MSSAVLERSRRATAGKRLASLVGQAAEDDDAFWSHKIWSEGRGGFSSGKTKDDNSSSGGDDGDESSDESSDGEGSYRASDEDSAAAVDQFDSDFDESESSSDEEDVEAELLAQERKDKRAAHLAATGAGRQKPVGKGRGAIKAKRVLGEGWNAGLVLNWFPVGDGVVGSSAVSSAAPLVPVSSAQSAGLTSTVAVPSTAQPLVSVVQSAAIETIQPIQSSLVSQTSILDTDTKLPAAPIPPTLASVQTNSIPSQPVALTKAMVARPESPSRKRNLRAGTLSKTIATVQQSEISDKITKQRSTAAKESAKQGKRHFTQEEMILEALKETEVENNKWILGRKRKKEMDQEEVKQNNSFGSGTVVERFYSRRGGSNVISFMDMERLPDILTRQHNIMQSTTASRGGSPKRKRSNSEGSNKAASDTSSSRVTAKCVITGKEARYRDPKTMLGYHDLEAFKELRRHADAGLLPSSGAKSNRGKKLQSFPKDRTMMASTSAKASVKVVVTQNGTPVSPPEVVAEMAKSNVAITSQTPSVDAFPTKRGPPVLPEGVGTSNTVQTVSNVLPLKSTNSNTAVLANQALSNSIIAVPMTVSSTNNNDNTTPVSPARKSPRKPKPSAKVLAEAANSQRLLQTDSNLSSNNMNIQPRDETAEESNTIQLSVNNGLPKIGCGIPDKSKNEDSPTAIGNTQSIIPPRNEIVQSSADLSNSNGAKKTIEKANESGPRNGSSETANLSNKEIAA